MLSDLGIFCGCTDEGCETQLEVLGANRPNVDRIFRPQNLEEIPSEPIRLTSLVAHFQLKPVLACRKPLDAHRGKSPTVQEKPS